MRGFRIYWTALHTTHDYTLLITITQRLVFSITCYSFVWVDATVHILDRGLDRAELQV
jgi:hypothetical protein